MQSIQIKPVLLMRPLIMGHSPFVAMKNPNSDSHLADMQLRHQLNGGKRMSTEWVVQGNMQQGFEYYAINSFSTKKKQCYM
jgi:hypothetical protein